jgi:glycosyltransferase involved in cell wall biosynthesis
MLYFICAVYNEEFEIPNVLGSVIDSVDGIRIVDDGSIDMTREILIAAEKFFKHNTSVDFEFKTINHCGLPETVKHIAKEMVPDDSWILMLDADERLETQTYYDIAAFVKSPESDNWDYIYFDQKEIIDGNHVRSFQKCKLFRKSSVQFPLNNIHADDQFTGRGTFRQDWVVLHRKTSSKQVTREMEYLHTYQKLFDEGHIDQGRLEWLKGLHHYVRS